MDKSRKQFTIFITGGIMSEAIYWSALSRIPGLQGQKGWLLINHFGSARGAWEAGTGEIIEAKVLGPKTVDNFMRLRNAMDPERDLEIWRRAGIECLTFLDEGYPGLLKNIFDPPLALYCRGEFLPDDNRAVAIVGARKSSVYGRLAAEKIAGDLARGGVTVVSGLARGIDTAAHKGALEHNGRTIAVLGCGVDIVYPAENRKYYDKIPQHGALLSEFPPGTPPEGWHFPLRNRIISGLSRGVVVVEAAEKSGTLITVDCALEQGREVFAVPGNITSTLSMGTNRLIKQGAALADCGDDILFELGMAYQRPSNIEEAPLPADLTATEKRIMDSLSDHPLSFESLVHQAGLPSAEAASLMMMMELKGLVQQLPGQRYVKSCFQGK